MRNACNQATRLFLRGLGTARSYQSLLDSSEVSIRPEVPRISGRQQELELPRASVLLAFLTDASMIKPDEQANSGLSSQRFRELIDLP